MESSRLDNQAAVCPHVFSGAPVFVAVRKEPGWQFYCEVCDDEGFDEGRFREWPIRKVLSVIPEFKGLLGAPVDSIYIKESDAWVAYREGGIEYVFGAEVDPYGEREVYIPGATRQELIHLLRKYLREESNLEQQRLFSFLCRRLKNPEPETVIWKHTGDCLEEDLESAIEAAVDELMSYQAIELGPPPG